MMERATSLSACLTLSFALWTRKVDSQRANFGVCVCVRACVYVCMCVRLCVLCVFVCVCINGVYINAPASRCFSDSDALLSRVCVCVCVCVYMLYTQDVVSRVASGSSLFLLHGRAFKVAMCLLHQLYEVE